MPFNPIKSVIKYGGKGAQFFSKAFGDKRSKQPGVDEGGYLRGAAEDSGRFAGAAEENFGRDRTAMRQTEGMLRDYATGKTSLSAEQLRQGLQQNVAGQRSMAAGARGGGAAMASRQAMINASRMGAGLSGQQAMAGIAERQAFANALADLQTKRRQQELQAAIGSRGNQLQGLSSYEGNLTSRYGADLGVPSSGERAMGLGAGLLQSYMLSGGGK